jgi:hypothetical protein
MERQMMGCRHGAKGMSSGRNWLFVCAVASVQCAGEPGPGSESHFLRCEEDSDCPIGACVRTYCEKDGKRVTSDQVSAQAAAGASSDGGGAAAAPTSVSRAGAAGADNAAIASRGGGGAAQVAADGGSAGLATDTDGAVDSGGNSQSSGGAAPGAGGVSAGGSSGAGGSTPVVSDAGDGGGGAKGETGACGHPLLHLRIEAVQDVDLCAAPLFITEPTGGEPLLWVGDTTPVNKPAALLPSEGLELVWGGQLLTQGDIIYCTNSEPPYCEYETENVCLVDRADIEDAWPKDAAGDFLMTFMAYPVSPRGTCADDLMVIKLPFNVEQGGTLSVKASDFAPTVFPETFSCGNISCNTATEYCEAYVQTTDAGTQHANPVCQAYPEECFEDHMCECLQHYLVKGPTCSGGYLAGPTTVLWPEQ